MVSRNCFLNETVGELTLLADLSTIGVCQIFASQ